MWDRSASRFSNFSTVMEAFPFSWSHLILITQDSMNFRMNSSTFIAFSLTLGTTSIRTLSSLGSISETCGNLVINSSLMTLTRSRKLNRFSNISIRFLLKLTTSHSALHQLVIHQWVENLWEELLNLKPNKARVRSSTRWRKSFNRWRTRTKPLKITEVSIK